MNGESQTLGTIRRLLLLLVAGGTVAMGVDLTLVGHYEDSNQAIPLVVGGAGLLTMMWVALRPSVARLRVLQFIMLCFIGTGIIGVVLHFQANAEFQREIDPAISTRDLIWKVVEATAPPALSPGLLVQLGLLGLVYTYKHPALGAPELGPRTQGDQGVQGD